MENITAFATTLPVIFLILLGLLLKRVNFFSNQSIGDLKKLVVNIALPMVLFNAFGGMKFQTEYLLIVGLVFIICVLTMQVGIFLAKKNRSISPFMPMILAGFEAGMIGYAVYTSLFGLEQVKEFAIIDLGQVIFVFFILVPSLQRRQNGSSSVKDTFITFLKTPVIVAIVSGLVCNFTGIYIHFEGFPITQAILETSKILASLTMPLAALVLGYELNIQPGNLRQPFVSALVRLGFWVMVAFLFNFFVIRQWLNLSWTFETAVWFMFILPPPFVVPLYLQKTTPKDKNYILNTISISTIMALLALVTLRMILPG